MSIVPNLSSDETNLSKLPVSSPRTIGNKGMNTPEKSPSTQKRVSEPVPKAGNASDILSHLSVPSQTAPVSSSRTPSPSPLQKGRTPSPKPESMRPKSTLFGSETTKVMDSGTVGTDLTGGLFGSTLGSSSNSSITERPSRFFNGDAKPQAGGIFSGTDPFGFSAAKAASGNPSSTVFGSNFGRNSFGNPEAATPGKLFGQAKVSGGLFGSTSDATTSNASFGSFGNSSGTAQTKKDNNLKWVWHLIGNSRTIFEV